MRFLILTERTCGALSKLSSAFNWKRTTPILEVFSLRIPKPTYKILLQIWRENTARMGVSSRHAPGVITRRVADTLWLIE